MILKHAVAGRIGVGWVNAEGGVENEMNAVAGAQEIFVPVLSPERVRGLMFRNTSQGRERSELLLESVDLLVRPR